MEAGYNAWRLTSLSPWPRWSLAVMALVALGAVLLALRGLASEPRRGRRTTLLALRSSTALLAFFLCMEPAVRFLQTAHVKSRLAVLVDTSRSMNFPIEPGGPPRSQVAADFVRRQRAKLEALGDRVSLEWHTFDRDLSPSDPSSLIRGLPGRGNRTDILGALKAAVSGTGRKLAGAVIISDGTDNAALADGISPAARAELRALNVPLTTVAVGTSAPKDLAIERVAVDDFAFVRNTATIEVTLAARGFGREEVPIALRREGTVVAQTTVKLEPGKEHYEVPLSFAPDTTGTFVFTVSAPVYPGEAVTDNNSHSFLLRVIRDRVRVLLVAGRPSWDERFLRSLLKQDPNIDLISFFILRTSTDLPGPQEELSLIPFPVAEIFGEQLRTFDAVFFVNFAYQPYRSLDIERYLPALREYVKGGGAFAMLGGEQSFGEAHYGESALSDILPVGAPEGLGIAEEPVRPRLTAEGLRHPVTSLAPGEGQNQGAWNKLPVLPDVNRTSALAAATGARTLLEAPNVLVEGRPAPVVAVREVGSGRTLAVTTDSSWFWGFLAAEESGSNRAYQRFWNNALRWLVRDPALTPLQVEPERPAVEPGEPIGLSVSVRAPDYGPGAGAKVSAELLSEDGRVVGRGAATAGNDGTARLEFANPGPGAYKVMAGATPRCGTGPCPPGTPVEQATTAIAVRASGPEDADAAPRPDLLRALAETTHGSFSSADRGLPEVHLLAPEIMEVGRRKDVPIWDRAWFLAGLVLSLSAEWILRRRWGHW
ncbi:MAG TPA: glutamine amidotransferase [Anaeromyxobacteraceae bacterium]|nr:glutamine amidotransferase [Anaeromyxobacteraceae bacterium]